MLKARLVKNVQDVRLHKINLACTRMGIDVYVENIAMSDEESEGASSKKMALACLEHSPDWAFLTQPYRRFGVISFSVPQGRNTLL